MNQLPKALSTATLAVFTLTASAEVYTLADQFAVNDNNYATAPVVLSSATHPGFTPIDDTFEGTLLANFTIAVATDKPTLNGTSALTFHLYRDAGATEVLGIGNGWWAGAWSVWKGPYGNSPANLLDSEGAAIPIFDEVTETARDTQRIRFTVNYHAGADDTAYIQIAGGTTELLPADYSFEEILTKSYDAPSDFTEMSVEIIPASANLTWEGYPVTDGYYCETGKFLGLVWVEHAPWVYSFALHTWVWVPENFGKYNSGRWVYFAR